MGNLKNINLDVASFAMKCVRNAIEDQDIHQGKYKTLAKKMSTLIQKNGLIATLTFVLSKSNIKKLENQEDVKKKQYNNKILNDIIEWNNENKKINHLINFVENNIKLCDKHKYDTKSIVKYIESVTNLNPVQYRLITKEMMTLFGWIKRFADGMIEGED